MAPPSGRRPGADAPPCPPLATPLIYTLNHCIYACTIIISFYINFNGKISVIYYRRFVLVSVCEKYASEFDILFNGSKSKLLFFKERFSNGMESGIMVNREIVNISVNAVHLGHTISSSDRESISLTAKSSFWKSFKSFISNFGHTYSFIKCSLFKQFCCSFYSSPL